jgi:hypothetical protein
MLSEMHAIIIIIIIIITRDCLRLCPALSSSQIMGFEPSISWRVAAGNIEMSV